MFEDQSVSGTFQDGDAVQPSSDVPDHQKCTLILPSLYHAVKNTCLSDGVTFHKNKLAYGKAFHLICTN